MLDLKKGTKTAVLMGKIIAILLLIYGAVLAVGGTVNLSLLVLPFFLYVSANKEEDMLMYTIIKDVVNKEKYMKDKRIMDAVQICAYENTPIREVLKHFDKGKYHIVIIINNSMEIEDILTESQIMGSISRCGANTTLRQLSMKIRNN